MELYEQHAYDEESEVRVVVCMHCGMVGHYMWSCPSREQAQAMNSYNMWPVHEPFEHSYNPWPINEPYGNSHNQWSSYEPYDNTYNPEWRNHQDFSWSHNEVNTYEQPISPSMEELLQQIQQQMDQFQQQMQQLEQRNEVHFQNIHASLRRIDVKIRQLIEVQVRQLAELEQEDVATIPLYGEIVDNIVSHELSDDFSSVADEDEETEVEKEETKEKAKEAEDVPFEEPLIYKELKPYVPPITFPSRLHKSKWNKWFSELISSHLIVNIYLPLLIVCRNMPAREFFFQDLITYRLKFETLEFG